MKKTLPPLAGDLTEFDEGEDYTRAVAKLQTLASCFAQLTHKASTIFQHSAKLEVGGRGSSFSAGVNSREEYL